MLGVKSGNRSRRGRRGCSLPRPCLLGCPAAVWLCALQQTGNAVSDAHRPPRAAAASAYLRGTMTCSWPACWPSRSVVVQQRQQSCRAARIPVAMHEPEDWQLIGTLLDLPRRPQTTSAAAAWASMARAHAVPHRRRRTGSSSACSRCSTRPGTAPRRQSCIDWSRTCDAPAVVDFTHAHAVPHRRRRTGS